MKVQQRASCALYCISVRNTKKQIDNKTYDILDIDAKLMTSKDMYESAEEFHSKETFRIGDILLHVWKFKFTLVMKNATDQRDFLFKTLWWANMEIVFFSTE